MKRAYHLLIVFICWGVLILLSGVWIITQKKAELYRFSRRIASKNIEFHPLRAPILDKNGEIICFSKWEFYFVFHERRSAAAEKFCKSLGIKFAPHPGTAVKYLQQNIPDEKITDAVKKAKKYRIRIRRRSVRCMIDLPLSVQYMIGRVWKNDGLWGIEAKYNKTLQGKAGFYNVMLGPDGRIEQESFSVIVPMQEGEAVVLPYSKKELQNPFIVWRPAL